MSEVVGDNTSKEVDELDDAAAALTKTPGAVPMSRTCS